MDADIAETMLAWRVPRFGGVESLRQESLSVPEPAHGEVLIEVQAAALNPVDLKTLQGRYPLITQGDLPYTLGRDVAGVVVSRGEGAQAWPQGARVCAFVGQGPGALADYVVVDATALAARPQPVPWTQRPPFRLQRSRRGRACSTTASCKAASAC